MEEKAFSEVEEKFLDACKRCDKKFDQVRNVYLLKFEGKELPENSEASGWLERDEKRIEAVKDAVRDFHEFSEQTTKMILQKRNAIEELDNLLDNMEARLIRTGNYEPYSKERLNNIMGSSSSFNEASEENSAESPVVEGGLSMATQTPRVEAVKHSATFTKGGVTMATQTPSGAGNKHSATFVKSASSIKRGSKVLTKLEVPDWVSDTNIAFTPGFFPSRSAMTHGSTSMKTPRTKKPPNAKHALNFNN